MVDCLARHPVAAVEMVVQHGVGGLQAALQEGDHAFGALVRGQEVHQEAGGADLGRKLVVVPEQPAQHLAPFGGRAPAQLAGLGARCSRGSRPTGVSVVSPSTSTGTSPISLIARNSGLRASPLKKSTKTGSQSMSARVSASAALVGVAAFAEAVEFHGHPVVSCRGGGHTRGFRHPRDPRGVFSPKKKQRLVNLDSASLTLRYRLGSR